MNAALARLAAPSPAPAEKEWKLGAAVVDGRLSFLSVSQVQEFALCERRWWYAKVKHLAKPRTKALDVGTEAHKQWAHYLSTGQDVLGDVARIAKPLLPAPGPDLLVEQKFCSEDALPVISPVTAAGVPLIGDIDLINPREGIRVTDHKTSSTSEVRRHPSAAEAHRPERHSRRRLTRRDRRRPASR
jgi:CRISPR/Cas system-associated exonuclease Cas4 (RecB family)